MPTREAERLSVYADIAENAYVPTELRSVMREVYVRYRQGQIPYAKSLTCDTSPADDPLMVLDAMVEQILSQKNQDPDAVRLGKYGGHKERARKKMTPEERSASAKKAGIKRRGKRRGPIKKEQVETPKFGGWGKPLDESAFARKKKKET